jgi:hypothetical protein
MAIPLSGADPSDDRHWHAAIERLRSGIWAMEKQPNSAGADTSTSALRG